MPEISKDIVPLLSFLLPGFLVAWVFYALTSHQVPAQLERVIQALIFTLFVKAAVTLERMALDGASSCLMLGRWNPDAELFASLITAVLIGFIAAYVVNQDSVHQFLRDRGISRRSSHPSEWYGALSTYTRYVILHLKDERRLYGWPEVWPSDPEKGHFFIVLASWLDPEGNVDLQETEGLLVDVRDVKVVEFIKPPEGIA